MSTGVTVGKFAPFHLGHKLMVDFAAATLDHVDVIVSGNETDVIPLARRLEWVTETYRHSPNVTVHRHVDDIPPGEVDRDGTVIDEGFWQRWVDVFRRFSPEATHFVSNDQYGKKAADLMGLQWLSVDPNRETMPISGTLIRMDPMRNFEMIAPAARSHFVKRVVIVGAESTGKSVMTRKLARDFSTIGVHEYGRTLSEQKDNELALSDFMTIAEAQNRLVELTAPTANRVLFVDTEAYTTYLFSSIYTGETDERIRDMAIAQHFDLYVVLMPTVKWVDDGWRVLPAQEKRNDFSLSMIEFLQRYKKPYVIARHQDYDDRYDYVRARVRMLMNEPWRG